MPYLSNGWHEMCNSVAVCSNTALAGKTAMYKFLLAEGITL